jgi:hypothetical protein
VAVAAALSDASEAGEEVSAFEVREAVIQELTTRGYEVDAGEE